MFKSTITFACGLGIALFLLMTQPVHAEDDESEEGKTSMTYIPLDPPFVVNFGPGSTVRFLQVTVELGTRDADAVELIRNNRPAIRNNLVFLFSDQDASVLETREGKSRLREDALSEARRVIQEEGGKDGIDTIYFTSFVMQ